MVSETREAQQQDKDHTSMLRWDTRGAVLYKQV